MGDKTGHDCLIMTSERYSECMAKKYPPNGWESFSNAKLAYCPECGKKLDWGAIADEWNRRHSPQQQISIHFGFDRKQSILVQVPKRCSECRFHYTYEARAHNDRWEESVCAFGFKHENCRMLEAAKQTQ